jgi:hypothetical protein
MAEPVDLLFRQGHCSWEPTGNYSGTLTGPHSTNVFNNLECGKRLFGPVAGVADGPPPGFLSWA